MTRAFSTAVVLAAAVAASACSPQSGSAPTGPTTGSVVSLSVSTAPAAGSAIQLTATGRMADGSSQDVTHSVFWDCSNPLLATISSSGLVTPLGKGEVDVRASYLGLSATAHLSVALPAVTNVTIAGAQGSGSFQLTATARRADNSSQNVTGAAIWESSDPRIALVSASGYVTVVADGAVDLSATFEGTTGTLHANVSVPKIYAVSGVVTDAATGKPIAAARIQVLGGPHGVTDVDGKYKVTGVSSGRALVEFSADGYEVEERSVDVDSDVTLSVMLMTQTQP